MTKVTLCPHYLMEYKYNNPKDIEKNILRYLTVFLLKLKESNVQLVLSKVLYSKILETFPWDKGQDNLWAGFIKDWQAQILPYLQKAKFISHEEHIEVIVSEEKCQCVSNETKIIFENFLEVFAGKTINKQLSEEGLFCNEECGYTDDYKSFLIINENLNNFRILLYPWLRVYPKDSLLPVVGEYTFVPPSDWRNSLAPLKNHKEPYGFIDDDGKVWKWDLDHKDHWDVQLSAKQSSKGNYLNITPHGKLLERK